MLLDRLKVDVTTSLKSGDKNRVETLRYLLAAVQYAVIAKYGANGDSSVTDEDVQDVIKKQVKTHRESIEAFQKAGRQDLVTTEHAQLVVLESFLPKQVSDEELKMLLAPVVTSGETNFGLLMKQAMSAVGGRAEGGRVSAILKQMLQR